MLISKAEELELKKEINIYANNVITCINIKV